MLWQDGGHMFGIGGIWMVIFWMAIIVWMVWLLSAIVSRNTQPHPPASAAFKTAEQLVKDRYARGEISREEYLSILNDLKNQ